MTNTRRLSKSQIERRREKTFSFIILFIVAVIWMIPFIYMFGTSFKTDYELMTRPKSFFPSSFKNWTLKHYAGFIIRDGQLDNMPIWMFNSLWSTTATVLLNVVLDLLMAYALAFLKFKGRKVISSFLIIWMAVPAGLIGMTPKFAFFQSIRNTLNIQSDLGNYLYIYLWVVLPSSYGIFNMFLLKNYFNAIPKDIVESAQADGASHLTIFRRIVAPLAKSTVMLIVLFVFTGSWNGLNWVKLLTAGEPASWKTITVAISGHTGGTFSALGDNMATALFALIPVLIIFAFTQNKMIDGVATTGVKG